MMKSMSRWLAAPLAVVGMGLATPEQAEAQVGLNIGRGGVNVYDSRGGNVPNNFGRTYGPGYYGGSGPYGQTYTQPGGINIGRGGVTVTPERTYVAPYGAQPYGQPYGGQPGYYSNDPNMSGRPNYVERGNYVEQRPYVVQQPQGQTVYTTPSSPSVRYENAPRSSAYLAPAPSPDRPAVGITLENSGQGVRIDRVHADSPAERAGLRAGDVIRGVNGRQVRTDDDVVNAIASASPGQKLRFDIGAGDQVRAVEVEVATRATALQR